MTSYKINSVRTRYKGETASEYDKKRAGRKKWKIEIKAIKNFIDHFEPDSIIVDLPVGTGRLFPLFDESSHKIFGIDISFDMLQQVKRKFPEFSNGILKGDAVNIPLKNNSVDYILCLRLMNWVQEATMKKILNEFHRVARKGFVFGFRCQEKMSSASMLKYAILNAIPTMTNIRMWNRKIADFGRRVIGKIKYEYNRLTGKPSGFSTAVNKEVFIRTYYNKEKMFKLFSEIGLEIVEEVYIDTICHFSKRIAKPYSLYLFKYKDTDTGISNS